MRRWEMVVVVHNHDGHTVCGFEQQTAQVLKLRDHPPPFDGYVDEEDTPCSVSRLINKLLKCSHEGEHDQAQLSPYMSSCIYLLLSQSIMPYYGLCGLEVSVMSDSPPHLFSEK